MTIDATTAGAVGGPDGLHPAAGRLLEDRPADTRTGAVLQIAGINSGCS